MGIISDDFELLLKKNSAILEDLFEEKEKLVNNLNSLIDCFEDSTLKFLVSKIDDERKQVKRIMKKINAYQVSLNSVYNSYQEQLVQIVSDTKKLIS